MLQAEKPAGVLRVLIALTFLFICAQITFFSISEYLTGLLDILKASFTARLLFSKSLFPALAGFFLSQCLVYSAYVFVLWYVASAICDLFKLTPVKSTFVCLFLWLNSILSLLTLNAFFVPHSVFTKLFRHDLFNDALTDGNLRLLMDGSLTINLVVAAFALLYMGKCVYQFKHLIRQGVMIALLASLLILAKLVPGRAQPSYSSEATDLKPNIILLSFDGVRPDFLSYFNKHSVSTPHLDEFLQEASVFTRTYTPIARTMPSWADILTAQYPVHNQVRENNTLLDLVKINETLPKRLREAGYATLYATDDRRYNLIDQRYGFDQVVGPAGTVPDFMLGTLNDFPLSNLLATTSLGKILFPYSYANHGAELTYDPNNFLAEIGAALPQKPLQPLFLAAHFNLSGWPFYWFNDRSTYNASALKSYNNAMAGNDKLFANFMSMLEQHQLLEHAIVVLISDHGMTLGLRGDRAVQEAQYEGDQAEMKLVRYKYAEADSSKKGWLNKTSGLSLYIPPGSPSPLDMSAMGIDTSYGYGSDLLSLKQYLTLFAIRGYGVYLGPPHHVTGRSLLMDIAPTLLDFLQLPPLQNADGISLKSALLNPSVEVPERPIYLESSYNITAMEQRDIVAATVAAESLKYFYINANTGAVTIYPPLMKVLNANKQRAVLQGDWLLVYYPASERFTFVQFQPGEPRKTLNGILFNTVNEKGENIEWGVLPHPLPPYTVLLNVKTGKWTTSLQNPLALGAPVQELKQAMYEFFGDEMSVYEG